MHDFPRPIKYSRFLTLIKDLCKMAGINELVPVRIARKGGQASQKKMLPKYKSIGTHITRRSFASNYYGIIHTPLLKNITGHATEEMLLRYIGVSSSDTSDWAIEQYKAYKKTIIKPLYITEIYLAYCTSKIIL